MNWQPTHPTVRQLILALRAETSELYLVGGAVRDLLLDRSSRGKDFDFVVGEPALAVARRTADKLGWAYFPLDEGREIARILFTDAGRTTFVCDIARMRGGSIEADLMARDFTVNALALGWNERGQTELIDHCGGLADLHAQILRRVTPTSMADDAVRLLRAPRFMAQLDFGLDKETEVQIMRLARSLQLVKVERIRDELWKAMTTPQPVYALAEMRRLGLLCHVLPEVSATEGITQSQPHHLDVFQHTLQTVERAQRIQQWLRGAGEQRNGGGPPIVWSETDEMLHTALEPWRYRLRQLFLEPVSAMRSRMEWLLWFAMLHDIGKTTTRQVVPLKGQTDLETVPAAPDTRVQFIGHERAGSEMVNNRLHHLRFSRQEINLAQRVVEGHMRPHHLHTAFGNQPISRRACYRFFRDVSLMPARQMAGFDILLLALSDYPAIFKDAPPPDWQTYLQRIVELLEFGFEQLSQPDARHAPLVDGRTLMRHFNLKPGRHIGEILEKLQEAQIAGEIESVEQALDFAAQDLAHRTRLSA